MTISANLHNFVDLFCVCASVCVALVHDLITVNLYQHGMQQHYRVLNQQKGCLCLFFHWLPIHACTKSMVLGFQAVNRTVPTYFFLLNMTSVPSCPISLPRGLQLFFLPPCENKLHTRFFLSVIPPRTPELTSSYH